MIEVESLTKRYGSTLAVDDLSFTVAPGTVTGFLGPNGAGKSTTLRALLGLVHPTSGRTAVLGIPYAELAGVAHRVGAVLETFAGTMHGSYAWVADDGTAFDAPVPAFTLAMPRTLH